MGHQLVLVVIDDPRARVIEQVESLIDRHSSYAKVEPYKQYFEPCSWDGRLWEADDAEEFARRRAQEYGETFESDENGIYQWIDTNPNAHYDWFEIGGRWDGIFAELCDIESAEVDGTGGRVQGNICPVEALPEDLFPGSYVAPDGDWKFFGWRFGGEDPDEEGIAAIRRIVEGCRGKYVVAVDVHA